MSTHTFTVNVPNPTAKATDVDLQLEPVDAADLRRMAGGLPRAKLSIEEAGISRDPCESGERRLQLRLKSRSSVDVHVTVVTGTPRNPATGGAVAVHLTDRRDGRVAGGVLLACVDPAPAEPAGQDIPTPRPCGVGLARSLYTVDLGADPGTPGPQSLTPGTTVELVAPLENATRSRLTGVTAYLEHLGGADAGFVPAAWNIGDLKRGDVFYATWIVTAGGSLPGSFDASIVVQSTGTDPTRLRARIRVAPPRDDAARPDRSQARARSR